MNMDFIINDDCLEKYTGDGGNITIPDEVEEIAPQAFENCNSLVSVIIPDSVVSIGEFAFAECANLESVKLPSDITEISDGLFVGCRNLQNVNVPYGVTYIGDRAFSWCQSLKNIELPDSIRRIGACAFNTCSKLEEIQLYDWVTQIGEQAFAYCNSLKSVTVPGGFTFVDANAFAFCNNLESVTIPEGSIHLGFGAFAGCERLKNVIIDESVRLDDERIFQGCPCLADENGFVIVNNVLYDYCGKDAVINIPEGVTCISNGAFGNRDWIKEVKIPDSVSEIGECAFERCEGMADESGFVIIRNTLQGYYGDSSVVVVPDGITAISKYVFAFKDQLTDVYIPDSVSYIGDDAFMGCDNITINASSDSYAIEYAEENWMEFMLNKINIEQQK